MSVQWRLHIPEQFMQLSFVSLGCASAMSALPACADNALKLGLGKYT